MQFPLGISIYQVSSILNLNNGLSVQYYQIKNALIKLFKSLFQNQYLGLAGTDPAWYQYEFNILCSLI